MADKYYKTDDYGQAAFLLLKKHDFLGAAGKKDHYKKFFVFTNSPQIQQEATNWEENLTDDAMQYKRYFIKISEVKKSLREPVDV